jgi:DNA-binding CsgD family transcriptional regulator/catechol 2,3-dioxygenase-like lactoylglutathione lyase family enzyme
MSQRRGRPAHTDVLTPAEWAVVEAVRHGMTNPQIARRRNVSLDAVKFHVANALQKLGLSSRVELRQWTGIRQSSALARQEKSIMNAQRLGPIGQIARSVKDIAAARAWFTDVLGLTHLYSFGNLAFFDCGGVRLFLTEGDGGLSESVLYFRVDDIRAAHKDLSARGVVFTHAPHLIHTHGDGTEEWMAFLSDNEGRSLAIMSQVRPG